VVDLEVQETGFAHARYKNTAGRNWQVLDFEIGSQNYLVPFDPGRYTCLMLLKVFPLLPFLLAPLAAHAGEPLFGYVYTTDTAPKGKFELEQWITDREGQAQGRFHHIHFNTEVEYGVSDRFQVSLYGNLMYDNDSGNSVRGRTEGIEIPFDHDSSQPYKRLRFDGISAEFLYRVLSPYTDPFGFALYLEPEVSPRDTGFEFRTIFQKNFFDDQLVLALNGWIEWENEKGSNLVAPGSSDTPDGMPAQATMVEADFGASYRVSSNWFVGLEFRNHNEFRDYSISPSHQDHTAYFAGPNIHYASQKWFFTLSALRQLGAVAFDDDQRAQMKGNLLYGDEHTTWDGIRLKIGVPF
jgi:hypothetical protein